MDKKIIKFDDIEIEEHKFKSLKINDKIKALFQ